MLIFISSGNVSRKDGIEKFDSPVRGGRNKEKTANVSMSGGGGELGSSYTVNRLVTNPVVFFKEKKLKYFVNQKTVNTKNISRLLLFLGNKAIGSVKTKP